MMTKKQSLLRTLVTHLCYNLATLKLNSPHCATFLIKAFLHISFLFHKFIQALCSFASFKSFLFLFGQFFVAAHCYGSKVCSSFLWVPQLSSLTLLLYLLQLCARLFPTQTLLSFLVCFLLFGCRLQWQHTKVIDCFSSHCFTITRVFFCELWGWRWNHKVDYTFNSRFHGTWY